MKRAKKNKFLKYLSLAEMTVVLGIYHILRHLGRHFASNGRRYAGVVFTLMFFMSSCSFSFAVFTGQNSFIDVQETYSAVVDDSDVAFAVEKEVPPDENTLIEEDKISKEYENTEDIQNVDTYTIDDILEDKSVYQLEEEAQAALEEGGLETVSEETVQAVEEIEFDSSDWRLVLVNKQHPIPEDYSFNLGTIKENMQCDERIIVDLLAMLQAAKDDGVSLVICSPYRNQDRQEMLFEKKIKAYMEQGYSYMEAYKTASQAVTIPGASEHQIGLSLDFFSANYTFLNEGFAETEAGKWLAEHSWEYGFILRYPEGKEYITSIEYEPWHFRYVGKEAAMVMTRDDLCLEEFWDKYL
ncbi:MAG: M15 family metallopeptidase [Roseburia sp.]|nr:M15 family metallopeptidase [Ruminococcus sp.]MCM1155296.1 M15 family metallopeptidase [Roseburia sp.]MCM1242900.1 M15 family metallopeptidase [Roseburia sp.]